MHILAHTTARLATLSLVASFAMVLALLPAPASAESHDFTNYREVPNNACDLDTPVAAFPDREGASQAHQRSIDCVAHHEITEGRDGLYHPRQAVTRDQMASFIARTLEAAGDRPLPEDPADHFEDTDGNVHEHRINQLAEIGVVQGRTADEYDTRGLVRRDQMASFIVRAAAWNHTGDVGAYTPAGDDPYFLDIEGNVHGENIRAGFELWLYEGREPGEYAPALPVRRDTMATFLTRVLDLVHPNIYETDNQTYVMSPMEPVTAPAGEPIEFSVDASRTHYVNGAEPIPGPVRQALHIALFPCANVDWEEPAATFADAAGDGLADDIAQSDHGHAYISEVNGEPVEGRAGMVATVPPQDGRITFTVITFGAQPDCTVPVAFDDRGPVDQLRLDAGNRPANPFGFVVASWE